MPNVSSLFALVVLTAGSCDPARFTQPLSEPATAKVDTALLGLWTGSDSDKRPMYVHVIALADGEMEFVLVGADDKEATVLDYRGIATGGRFLSLHDKTGATWSKEWLVAKYEIGADGALQLSWLANDAAAKGVSAKKLKGTAAKNGETHVNDTPAHVLAWLGGADVTWSTLPKVMRVK